MRYVPNTLEQQEEMLQKMGLNSWEDLFQDIPAEIGARPS